MVSSETSLLARVDVSESQTAVMYLDEHLATSARKAMGQVLEDVINSNGCRLVSMDVMG